MLSAPEDYGLTPRQTLAHTVAEALPDRFAEYWREFREEIAVLSTYFQGSVDERVNRIVIPSLRSVRIIGRLELPDGPVRGAVIASHGYETPDDFECGEELREPWTSRGLATLRLRLRGFPPSTMEIDDLRDRWIVHNIESARAWIARGAVADLMQGYRCLRRHLGPDAPISFHGESLGGGLAVIAAAQLGLLDEKDPPFRLALALPGFGDWRWRSTRYCNGPGGQVKLMLDTLRGQDREELLATLLLFDAALQGRFVRCPVLCKSALRDDTVPAPTAAAVFNGLAGGQKWRFITPFGHYEGGLANARRHAVFERICQSFLDPSQKADEAARLFAGELEPETL
ncbi:MAG: acetylxylan esterase [Phycisphaerales bacterium]|nr:MAG: acetylxylan esterase [Phycisphaerales bacterium]